MPCVRVGECGAPIKAEGAARKDGFFRPMNARKDATARALLSDPNDGITSPLCRAPRRISWNWRDSGKPILHIQRDAGADTPFDIRSEVGAIAQSAAPDPENRAGEARHEFLRCRELEDRLRAAGIENIILAGFMAQMRAKSTGPGAFSRGLSPQRLRAPPPRGTFQRRLGRETADALQLDRLTALRDRVTVIPPWWTTTRTPAEAPDSAGDQL